MTTETEPLPRPDHPGHPDHPDHPDFPAEQAYITNAYDMLDQGLAQAEKGFEEYKASDRTANRAIGRALEILRGTDRGKQLINGRMDQDGETFYIGRRRVYDAEKNILVMAWHAPAAIPFYEATAAEPGNLSLKRVFQERERQLLRILDEITPPVAVAGSSSGSSSGSGTAGPPTGLNPAVGAVGAAGSAPAVSDALLEELERSREGAMREVVATIQAEQFRIIRADRQRVVVVQGGPGTGKTVVGLHRAAWLAFNHPDLRAQGILVVAPNLAFLSYTSGVLPTLEAADVQQLDLLSLYAGEATVAGTDDAQTARIKGSAPMAEVLRRALEQRVGWTGDDLEFTLGVSRIAMAGPDIVELIDDVRRRGLPHLEGREVLRNSLAARAFTSYEQQQREARRPVVATPASIRRLSTFTNALDRMWPTLTAEELLRGLYGTQAWLSTACEGVLAADERAQLFRPPNAGIADEPWTAQDLFCLDELEHLLVRETPSYGHVVVDEAQDLSPMQARALARRCPSGSFTVLGDLAQGTSPWVGDSWSEVAGALSAEELQLETLSIGYRVPAPVLELAARQLPLISPGLSAPQSVRFTGPAPAIVRHDQESLPAEALALAVERAGAGLSTAVIVPDHRYHDVLERAAAAGITVGAGGDGLLGEKITVLPATLSKGLEFDAVVLVAPDELVLDGPRGRRVLYVAMTRCTQELHIVHSAPLPAGLESPSPSETGSTAVGSATAVEAGTARQRELAELVHRLSADDVELVQALVLRLLNAEAADSAEAADQAGSPDLADPAAVTDSAETFGPEPVRS